MKQHLEQLLQQAVAGLKTDGTLPADVVPAIEIDHTKTAEHGDFATNLALTLAKSARVKPRELAVKIVGALPKSPQVNKVEIAGPGFINFFLNTAALTAIVPQILAAGAAYGRSQRHTGDTIQVEFVSANPTGPLHVGHGRQAALGDALAALFESQGYSVVREFYYNDGGVQIGNLALSVQARVKGMKPGDPAWPAAAYNGEYIQDIANDFLAKKSVRAADGETVAASGDVADLEGIRKFAVAYLRKEQDIDLQKFGVKFDVYYLESSLYAQGKVLAFVDEMVKKGKAFEEDGALYLGTMAYGDDKNRVMRKSDGTFTYFVPDVAYHRTKWERGFKKVVNVQGTDHHSTITRVRAGLQALDIGIPQGYPDYVLHSMVRVMRGGEEVKISKRAGSYVTLRDLVEWVGRDAARFFLVMRRADSEFMFDIDLALSQSEDNPVYYVQYAHARVCSVFRQLAEKGLTHDPANGAKHLERLTETHEQALLNRLARYPEMLEAAAEAMEPHNVAHYLRELAYDYHAYYNSHTFLVDDQSLRDARLSLIAATRQVIANGLAILGVAAPEKM
ncbi:MAG TPA: arginine--tRNA ligase [Burkholderiales bacterium]|nr:arginine--tRNA ligase [Burkholderiales bacterium]